MTAISLPYWQRGCHRLVWVEPFWVLAWWFLLILPPTILPIDILRLVFPALFLPWPLRRLAYGRASVRTPIDLCVALLLLWLPVTWWVSVDKGTSTRALALLVCGPALVYALVNWSPARRRPQIVAMAALLAGGAVALLGVLDAPPDVVQPYLSVVSSSPARLLLGEPLNPNNWAGAMALTVPLALVLALPRRNAQFGWQLATAIVAVALLGIVIQTRSLGAASALALAIGVVLLLRWPPLVLALPPLSLLAVGTVVYLGPHWVLNWIQYHGNAGGRLEIWLRARYAFHDFTLTGIGIGTFDRMVPAFYPYASPNLAALPHAHNLFLQLGLDLGLPGLAAYLALHLVVFFLLGRTLRQSPAPLMQALALGSIGGMLVLFLHGLVDVAVWGTRAAPLPWLLVALALLLAEHTRTGDGETTRAV